MNKDKLLIMSVELMACCVALAMIVGCAYAPDGGTESAVPISGGPKANAHENVQLWKDGPYWATTNIGAEKPWERGYYFWWGDVVGYKRKNGIWVASDGKSSGFSFDPMNTPTLDESPLTLQSNGWIMPKDGVNVLVPEHDAAHVHWGGDWRMPTRQEFLDLKDKCNWILTTTNGVTGYVVRGSGDYAGNSIFLPCVGHGSGTALYEDDFSGCYWSSVPEPDDMYTSKLYVTSNKSGCFIGCFDNYRIFGLPVRPVLGFVK